MNKWIAIGRLTADPEVRYTKDSLAIAKYSLAIDRRFKRDGESVTDFIQCTALGKNAEFAEKYLKKGTKIAIEGRIENNNYEKDGVMHYSYQIMVETQEFCEKKSNGTAPADEGFATIPEGAEDELPF